MIQELLGRRKGLKRKYAKDIEFQMKMRGGGDDLMERIDEREGRNEESNKNKELQVEGQHMLEEKLKLNHLFVTPVSNDKQLSLDSNVNEREVMQNREELEPEETHQTAFDTDTMNNSKEGQFDPNDNQIEDPGIQNINSKENPDFTKMILILTESRHGSTWLMDLLSYPDTSVPFFEPLNTPFLKMYARSEEVRKEALDNGHDPAVYWDWRAVILGRICLCDFYRHKITDAQLSGRRYGGIAGLGYKSKRLGTAYQYEYQRSLRMCANEDSFVVPKTIRLYNISELHLLPGFGCDNFKVIHLVRDPRAVMLSRIEVFRELYDGNKLLGDKMESNDQELYSEEYMRRAASDMCSHHLHSYQVGMNPPDWLKDRYKLVKYEDLATDPDRWAEELFQFGGIPYKDTYKQYVYNTTHIKERGREDSGSYSVEREAREVVNSWRSKLSQAHWITIEQECSELMNIMGYDREY